MKKKLLVTQALPYANGDLHLGHMLGMIQADIWVRTQRLLQRECYFICGDDAHGTPIMLNAKKQGIREEELIAQFYQSHLQDCSDFAVNFDNFYTTHSEENIELCHTIYQRLQEKGLIAERYIEQAYDESAQMFLPDRFIKGNCPKCNAADQYGDSCEVCGATYTPQELKSPYSTLSNTPPVYKKSLHYFFELPKLKDFLANWLQTADVPDSIKHKLQEWFDEGLKDWDISRDAPYFGIKIPGSDNKYFYVWLDAPIGYMASFANWCAKHQQNFAEFWDQDSPHQLVHFIGKDIIYFHALFWPALLHAAGYKTPDAIYVNGFLTVNKHKMSKSRGTFIKARDYLQHLPPEALRYYFAAKLNNNIEDFDFNFQDLMLKVNSELVNKVINIASRSAKFINKYFDNQLAKECQHPLLATFIDAGDEIQELYLNREYNKAIQKIISLAELANQYLEQEKPWVLIKDPSNAQQVQQICSIALNLFKILIFYLKPVIPAIAQASEKMLNSGALNWHNFAVPLQEHTIAQFKPLMQRISEDTINELIDALKK